MRNYDYQLLNHQFGCLGRTDQCESTADDCIKKLLSERSSMSAKVFGDLNWLSPTGISMS